MLAILVAVAVAGAIAALCSVNRVLATAVTIALLPWSGLEVDVGVQLTAYQLATIGLLFGSHVFPTPRQVRDPREVFRGFYMLMLWAALITLARLAFLPSAIVAGGILRSPAIRSLLQIPVFCLMFAPLYYVRKTAATISALRTYVSAFIVGCLLLATLGFIQAAIFQFTGTDILPLGIVNQLLGGLDADAKVRSGLVLYQGSFLFRMSSLGGEPRELGMSLVAACFILQLMVFGIETKVKVRDLVLYGFLFSGVLLTQSSSAAFVLILGWVCCAGLRLLNTGYHTGAKPLILTVGSVGFVVLSVVLFKNSAALTSEPVQWVSGLIEQRTIGRESAIEDFDQAILRFLMDKPENVFAGIGLGNAHLYANAYLDTRFYSYVRGSVFTAKSGYLRLISEIGLVGFVLYFMAFIRVIRTRRNLVGKSIDSQERKQVTQGSQLVMVFMVLYLARTDYINISIVGVSILGVANQLLKSSNRFDAPFRRDRPLAVSPQGSALERSREGEHSCYGLQGEL